MGGGLLQLVAYGAQDVYLTGNPQITFFKVIYRRYTNFSLESIEQTFNGQADFGKRVQCTISRNGDLISRIYLQVTLPSLTNGATWAKSIGLFLIKNVYVEIGGQQIDKHYAEWMWAWNELTQDAGKYAGYQLMTGYNVDTTLATTLYVPLEFWFCRNPGLALPLIALQYHEVKVNIEFRAYSDAVIGSPSTTPTLTYASLWVDYVFLDTDERRRFAQVSHEYLIEQLQFTGEEAISGTAGTVGNYKQKLNFNHPVKELVWLVQRDDLVTNKDYFNYSLSNTSVTVTATSQLLYQNPVYQALLQLNGHDRFTIRDGEYFSLVQPYQHHGNVPVQPITSGTLGSQGSRGINVYSFGLRPEEHQPSGTINMSRIDTAVLSLYFKSNFFNATTTTGKIRTYAVNYNVLRIISGMGGLNLRGAKKQVVIVKRALTIRKPTQPSYLKPRLSASIKVYA